ncbi:MAG: DUF1624 domain-containing protein [Betaproteobacteria bacterium]|nr:DUF1624 domain-containing protein [Betaproteobacteria bacterium]
MKHSRYDSIDALRGIAIVWMTVFHFCFDLNHFGWIKLQMLTDPVWTIQRTLIVSLFLFCAGLGQAVALERSAPGQLFNQAFWRRWAQVGAAAMLVSAGSWWMFGKDTSILASCMVLLRCWSCCVAMAGVGPWLWPLGLLFIAMSWIAFFAHGYSRELDFLHAKAFNWLGLIRIKPFTQDYVPVLPWLGVMCWGLAAGQWALARRPGWLVRPVLGARLNAPLAVLGRWSLSYYLLHQPVLIGLMTAVAWLLNQS